jgi:hypothetical protein
MFRANATFSNSFYECLAPLCRAGIPVYIPWGREAHKIIMSKVDRAAKERALRYKRDLELAEEVDPAELDDGELDDYLDIVGRRVQQAMNEGAFDHLPGAGKPQDLTKNPFVPEGQQMAFDLLHNNNLEPGWIGERKLILDEIARLRKEIQQYFSGYQAASQRPERATKIEQRWRQTLLEWEKRITTLNRRIGDFNLTQPIPRLEIIKLRMQDELKRAERNLS